MTQSPADSGASHAGVAEFTHRWRALADALGLGDGPAGEAEAFLRAAYGEPHRRYHTASHIVWMLRRFEALEDSFADPEGARLAVFFHDAIYDPAKSDNEARSAGALTRILSGAVDAGRLERAAFAVRATQAHRATGDRDADLVIDLDMAVLGQDWEVYAAYAAGVRKEYVPVYGEEAFRQGRIALFLEPTLAQPEIFIAGAFRELDAPAKRNLRRELDMLKRGDRV